MGRRLGQRHSRRRTLMAMGVGVGAGVGVALALREPGRADECEHEHALSSSSGGDDSRGGLEREQLEVRRLARNGLGHALQLRPCCCMIRDAGCVLLHLAESGVVSPTTGVLALQVIPGAISQAVNIATTLAALVLGWTQKTGEAFCPYIGLSACASLPHLPQRPSS